MQIQHGIVVSSTYIQEKSDAGKGALVGGAASTVGETSSNAATKISILFISNLHEFLIDFSSRSIRRHGIGRLFGYISQIV
jgi:hypothetical protein